MISTVQISKLRPYVQFYFLSASSSHFFPITMKNINYERSHYVVCAGQNLMYKYSPQPKFCSHRPSTHECTNPNPLGDRMLNFFTVVPDIFSETNALLLICKKMCISSHALRRKRPDNSGGAQLTSELWVLSSEPA